MSFQQGLSGLNGAAKSLDVIGNNIANSSTVGFKGSTTQFADVYARSLNGAGGNTAGIGVSVAAIAQQFTQGNIETSNNPLDIAINGAGFFRTSTQGLTQYTRNGQFSLDKNGFVVTPQGANLTGYQAGPKGQILAGSPSPLKIDTADLKPQVTTKVETAINLDSRVKPPENRPFNSNDPTTYNKQTPVDVYDTLGNPHVMSMYYVKSETPNTWDVYVGSDGTELANVNVASASQSDPATATARQGWMAASQAVPADAAAVTAALKDYADKASAAVMAAASANTPPASQATLDAIAAAAQTAADTPGFTPSQVDNDIAAAVSVQGTPAATLVFDSNGALSAARMADAGTTLPASVGLTVFPPTGAKEIIPLKLNFGGTTQYGIDTSEKKTTQDGYTAGHLQRFSASDDGIILGQYSNGQTKPLGQVVLANFTNPNGLEPLGNNAWAESSASGTPLVGTPGTGSFGSLQSSATEASNVDLTAELVNMITAQRVYQANAQTIKTQDSVLQTLVSLR
jgi:flagellar hook protein FlgE